MRGKTRRGNQKCKSVTKTMTVRQAGMIADPETGSPVLVLDCCDARGRPVKLHYPMTPVPMLVKVKVS